MSTATLESDGEQVSVEREDGQVVVTWLCGTERTFSEEDLALAVEHLESVAHHGDVWLTATDSEGTRYAARVVGNRFYADEHINASARWVQWTALRELLAPAEELAPPVSVQDQPPPPRYVREGDSARARRRGLKRFLPTRKTRKDTVMT